MIGQKFGRLSVVGYIPGQRKAEQPRVRSMFVCLCECGTENFIASAEHVRAGRTQSCGCIRSEVLSAIGKRNRTHGQTGTPEYMAWQAIIQRCTNPHSHAWRNYGGRGISVCDAWKTDFQAFLAHVGHRPGLGFSIDRIDNDGHYEPGNVRWATRVEQTRNRRPFSQWITGRRAMADLREQAAIQATPVEE